MKKSCSNRVQALIVSLVILMGLLGGCTSSNTGDGNADNTVSNNNAPNNTTASISHTNKFGWEVPTEPITITLLNGGGFYAPLESEAGGLQNNIDYLKEHFNVHLTVETITGDGPEALNLMLAAGNYPEVIYNINRDYVSRFVSQNRAIEVTPYMDTIASDVKRVMGEMYPLFLDQDDKLWYFPIDMGALYELPDYSAHIRYDEWQAIGAPEIETPDDYYNAINKILEMFPTNPNGETRYAISLYDSWEQSPEIFGGFWGLKRGYKINEDGDFTHWAFTDEGKELTKFLNRFFLDGTLDPDAFVNRFDDWKAKFSNERIVGAMGSWWISYNAGHEV